MCSFIVQSLISNAEAQPMSKNDHLSIHTNLLGGLSDFDYTSLFM